MIPAAQVILALAALVYALGVSVRGGTRTVAKAQDGEVTIERESYLARERTTAEFPIGTNGTATIRLNTDEGAQALEKASAGR